MKQEVADRELLQWLHWRDHLGWSMQKIADRTGRTRNSIIGGLNRVRKALEKSDVTHPCAANKSKNKDGGMKPLWWNK